MTRGEEQLGDATVERLTGSASRDGSAGVGWSPAETGSKKEASVKRELDTLVAQMYAGGITYEEAVREFKKRFLLEVLSHHRGNQCKSAKALGVHRNTLSRMIAELEINPTEIRMGLKRPVRSERPLYEAKRDVQ